VTVIISITGWPSTPRLRARNIICPAVSRNISISENSPGGGTKAWRTFAKMSAFKCTASVRFKAASPANQTTLLAVTFDAGVCPSIAEYARSMDAAFRPSRYLPGSPLHMRTQINASLRLRIYVSAD